MGHRLYSIAELTAILQPAYQVVEDPDLQIDTLAYDSRKLRNGGGALFFALKGLRDGHRFLGEAYEAGVRNFVIADRKQMASGNFPGANFLIVENTLSAMQELAAFHRSRFHYPVIAITGSNGKTIVKDWLYQLLSPEFRIVRSPKSYNSQLGVALSLWQMGDAYDLAIIEAGISRKGEMERLAGMIKPTIAVLTTVGAAHQEGFSSFGEKVREKLRLFEGAAQWVLPVDQLKSSAASAASLTSVASDSRAVPLLGNIRVVPDPKTGTTEIFESAAENNASGEVVPAGTAPLQSIVIPFIDKASIANAVTCWSVMRLFGFDHGTIRDRMRRLQMMEMRLQLKQGINHCTLIDDSYSNDLSSLAISLDLLDRQKQHPHKTLILSDLPEVSGDEAAVYGEVRKLLEHYQLDNLITVGPVLAEGTWEFPVKKQLAFRDTQHLLDSLTGLHLTDQTILIKGGRKFAFEQISARLAAQSHETRLEINMEALGHNIQQYKALLGPDVRIMAMVKAFSYGSGSFEIASLLQFHRIDYLAVAYADEGVALRKAGIRMPIMVMNPDRSSFDAMLQYQLEPELFDFAILREWVDWLSAQEEREKLPVPGAGNRPAREKLPVHIKIDTGMHRLGFDPARAGELGQYLAGTGQIRVASVFSHLAASGDPAQDAFTQKQIDLFDRACSVLAQFLPEGFIRHLANSDAIYRFPQARYGMVRLGIGLYGLDSGSDLDLQQVVTLKTAIAQIREVPAGEGIGYGRKGVLERDSRIATIRIGYADGYDRRFGRGIGRMRVHDATVPTVGDICMDMCMLDITDVPDAKVGDEVLVYGDLPLLAGSIGTIPYELLVSISQRVKRVYYYG